MSIKLIEAILDHPQAPTDPGRRLVLLVLAKHANDDGSEARPGLERLCRNTSLRRRSVLRHLSELQSAGWIRRDRRSGPEHATVWRIFRYPQQVPAVAPVEEGNRCHQRHEQVPPVAGTGATSSTTTPQTPQKLTQNNPPAAQALELVTPELLPDRSQQAATPVEEVFAAWAASRQHPNAVKLSDERRRLIAKQLKTWPVADLVDAVRGWQNDPFYRGENDRGQVYNDLGLLLRDAAHIEKFRDLWRNGPGSSGSDRRLARVTDLARRRGLLD